MKTKIINLMTAYLILSCTNSKEEKIMQNPNITSSNMIEEIIKNIKHYPIEKVYKFSYESYYAFFDVRVNDIPIQNEFEDFSSASAFEINPCIYKSGKQKVLYKMYPVGKVEDKFYNTLRDNSYLEIYLRSYDKKNESADDLTYNHYKTPSKIVKLIDGFSKEKFEGAGKEYYEGSFEIDVKVPYEMHPIFENAKNLLKIDKVDLQKKLLDTYQKVWNVYNNKEYDNIAKISYDALKEEHISKYDNEKYITEIWTTLLNAYKSNTFEMQPIKDYKLEFFADGKLIALMSTNPDFRNRGNTALWAKVIHEGVLTPLFINHYFYIPEGETEFKVY
jgi:hypothetical protein